MKRADPSLVPVEEARLRIALHPLKHARVRVALDEAHGCILARDVRADRDIPPFDRSAVDGYAVRLDGPWRKDGSEFRVAGRLPAGSVWKKPLAPGTAVRIMTGAPVPKGADGVVMVERSETLAPDRVRLHGSFRADGERPGIAPRGEDARRGEVVLARGTRIDATQVALLASVGQVEVPVYRRPTVAILTTGAEIVAADQRPEPWQIRNGDGPLLETLVRQSGAATLVRSAAVPDDFRALVRAVRRAADTDVLVLTGGVSRGDFDFVPDVLRECGVRVHLHRVAMRPGKPLLFGTRRSPRPQSVFGLPGNPLSALVTAWEHLLPYLRAGAGWSDPGPSRLRARAEHPVERKPGLMHFVLGEWSFDDDGVPLVREQRSHGSGDYVSAARANCLIPLPAESPRLDEGEWCWIHPFPR